MMSLSCTVAELEMDVHARMSMPQAIKLRILLGNTVLPSTKTLSNAGIGNDSLLNVCAVSSFDIYLTEIRGPNSPRFGCTSCCVYEMRCSCGYTESFQESHGYAVHPPERLITACPSCGAQPSQELSQKGYPSNDVKRDLCFAPTDPECARRRKEEERQLKEAAIERERQRKEEWLRTVDQYQNQEPYLEAVTALKNDRAFKEAYCIKGVEVVHPEKREWFGLQGFSEHPFACVEIDGDPDQCPQQYGDIKLKLVPYRGTPDENKPIPKRLAEASTRAAKKGKDKARAGLALLSTAATGGYPAQSKASQKK